MVDLMGYSVLVDNDQQERKLQEIAFEQGFEWIDGVGGIRVLGERSFQFGYGGEKTITFTLNGRHYQDKYVTKKAHFNDLFKTEFTPIAMKCTQEQFDAIRPKLKGVEVRNLSMFNVCNYLINNLYGDSNVISNVSESSRMNHNRVVHEEWNEEIFLKACRIGDETLEQQLEKAKAEVERLEKKIENNKIKFGDWVAYNDHVFKAIQDEYDLHYLNNSNDFKKITNPQLIELLEQEIK